MPGYLSNIGGTTEDMFSFRGVNSLLRFKAFFGASTGSYNLNGTIAPIENYSYFQLAQEDDENVSAGLSGLHLDFLRATSVTTLSFILSNSTTDGAALPIFYTPTQTINEVQPLKITEIPSGETIYTAKLQGGVLSWEPKAAGDSSPTVVHQSIEPLVGTRTVSITNPGVDYFLKEIHYGSITAWTTGGTRTIQVGVSGTLNKFGGSTITSTSNSAGNHNIFNTNIFQAQKIASGDTPILTYTNTGSAGGSMRVRLVWHKLVTISP